MEACHRMCSIFSPAVLYSCPGGGVSRLAGQKRVFSGSPSSGQGRCDSKWVRIQVDCFRSGSLTPQRALLILLSQGGASLVQARGYLLEGSHPCRHSWTELPLRPHHSLCRWLSGCVSGSLFQYIDLRVKNSHVYPWPDLNSPTWIIRKPMVRDLEHSRVDEWTWYLFSIWLVILVCLCHWFILLELGERREMCYLGPLPIMRKVIMRKVWQNVIKTWTMWKSSKVNSWSAEAPGWENRNYLIT